MRKVILGVAIAGVAASIAIAVRSQIATGPAADESAAGPVAGERAQVGEGANLRRGDGAIVTAPAPAPVAPASPVADPQAPVTAPDPVPMPLPVAEAEPPHDSVLVSASKAYSKIKTLKASFIQKRQNPLLGTNTTSRGTLYQKRPDRILLKFSQPAGDIIVSDGRYFWVFYPSVDAKQVIRVPASPQATGAVDLQAQFLGDPLRRFKRTYHGTEVVNGRKAHVFTLVPIQNIGYKSLKVWIDAKDYLARRFIISENNGVVQEFTLSDVTLNPALNNNVFAFTPPPTAKVIDR